MVLGTREVIISNYRIWAEPCQLWHRWTSLFWQSTSPRFKINFSVDGTSTDIPLKTTFIIKIQFQNRESTLPKSIEIPPSKSGDVYEHKLNDMPLMYTGDSFLTIGEALTYSPQTIYSFHTTSRSWFTLAIIAGVIAGVLSLIGQVIIAIFS